MYTNFLEKMVMYKIDRRGGGGGGSKNRSLGRTRFFEVSRTFKLNKENKTLNPLLKIPPRKEELR